MKHLTGSTADTLLEYIERNLPEGMAMKVTRVRCNALHLPIYVARVGEKATKGCYSNQGPMSRSGVFDCGRLLYFSVFLFP